jgi:phosphopantothenoylcysteine decarboxylase/phosphopantothenate--cysteine ligase
MDGGMYARPSTRANLDLLVERGAIIVGPATGHLASGLTGPGRMAEPAEVAGHVRALLGLGGPLSGYKVLVTAGGTQEAIDPVRMITNRSSGKQGYALAQVALEKGATVTLISGPTALEKPDGARMINVVSAKEMHDAVLAEVAEADILIMAAAVSDFRPRDSSEVKIKRSRGVPTIELKENPDILLAVGQAKDIELKVIVGFAAESEDLLENARHKLETKNLDLIVANNIGSDQAGFDVDTNQVVILDKFGNKDEIPLLSKAEVAGILIDRIVKLLKKKVNQRSVVLGVI